MRFECDYNATPPFYYYRFYSQYIKLPTAVEDSQSEYPWSVYAINASQNSPANVRVMPNILGKREQPLKINNFTVEFNNNIVCCQGRHDDQDITSRDDENVTMLSLSVMICYHLNVQCMIIIILYSYSIYIVSRSMMKLIAGQASYIAIAIYCKFAPLFTYIINVFPHSGIWETVCFKNTRTSHYNF